MYENVFVTRTFSKLFSLAGARLGYVVGCQNGIELVQKLCTPHNVNAFAQLFARKIIETPGMIEQLVHKYKEGRKYLEEMLQKIPIYIMVNMGILSLLNQKVTCGLLLNR